MPKSPHQGALGTWYSKRGNSLAQAAASPFSLAGQKGNPVWACQTERSSKKVKKRSVADEAKKRASAAPRCPNQNQNPNQKNTAW
jgi:hypothetical protein